MSSAASTPRRPRTSFLPPPPLFHRRPASRISRPSLLRPLRARAVPCACLKPTNPHIKNPADQYVPLHVHSDFSLLDGASQLPSLVDRASKLGVPALALTDHGVLYGAIQLVRTCSNTNVKPIIGNEMYIVNDTFDAEPPEDPKAYKPPKRYHLIVLAKNTTGYRNLVKLTTLAHLDGKVGKGIFARPCINKAQLYEHREGLIVSSACLGGEIPQAILNDDMQSATTVASWYRDVFGDDFYLEIQDHGSAEDKKVNPRMIELSRSLGIKVIATNDSHFTSCLDAEAHDALICIQTGKLLTDDNRLHYAGNEYFKSVEEMRKCFVDHLPIEAVDEALYNTIDVAAKVEKYDLFGATRIPDFPIPAGFHGPHDEYLRHVSRESLRVRLDARQKAGLASVESGRQYFDRLEFELDMICKMGFSSYFLVVWDYVKHAKELGIPVGPGRGSAAGSLVAFALRITDVDPIPFNLLFERFLNPERKSMPDIDTDFSVKGREKVISYVSQRYGTDRVAQIITFNRLTSKAVLKDVARVHSVPYAEADRLAKLIPVVRGKPATLTKLLSEGTPSRDFKQIVDRNPSYKTWIDKAMRIEGANKTFGIHAAGVVISASPLTDIVPLSRAKHGETITQYAMEDVESLGLLKMDFLGLKNLTVIETALEFITDGRRKLGIGEDLDFSVDALPLDDENTYRLLAEGELDGIFQLDASAGMRNIVRELRPSSLEDISSILALYRPGPLDAGLIPKFIRRKHGIDPIEYDHPLLEPILKETYGIMVYQEQIMRIARDLAGYSLGQADILRRAMGKKKTADMEREKPRFLAGAKERGVSEEKAIHLFDMMIKFAEYCFNKSHSTAYAYLTYQTAYLKANYPVEYSAALLRSNMTQSDKLVRYLADANVSGVRVAPPCVNKSDLGFTVDRSNDHEAVVLFGLEAVKTVGESVSRALLDERNARGPFTNIIDLVERVNLRVLNKRAMGALIQAGAFDGLHPNRKVLLNQLDDVLALRRKLRDRQKRRASKGLSEEDNRAATEADALLWEEAEMRLGRDSENMPDFSLLDRLAGEKATLGFYASGHPLFNLQQVAKIFGCTRIDHIVGDIADSEDTSFRGDAPGEHSSMPDGSEVMILSCVTELKRITTAKGKKMAKWIIEDSTGRVAGVVFPGAYDIIEQVLRQDTSSADVAAHSQTSPEEGVHVHGEPSFVVEEDARVIVWGKIDRESSGTAQIVIDDVQRVETVKAVVATAPHDRMRPPLTQLQVLRHMAARILEVDLSKSGFSSYVDANGETRKRRWSKATPLSKKNRVPLLLRCLDETGKVSSYMNAGNVVRFPVECVDLLQPLSDNTGFGVELLSVNRDILAANDEENAPGLKQPETGLNGEERKECGAGLFVEQGERHTVQPTVRSARGQGPNLEVSQVSNHAVTERETVLESGSLDLIGERETELDDCSSREGADEQEENITVSGVSLTPSEHAEFLSSSKRLRERTFGSLSSSVITTTQLEASLIASTRLGRQNRMRTKESITTGASPRFRGEIQSGQGYEMMRSAVTVDKPFFSHPTQQRVTAAGVLFAGSDAKTVCAVPVETKGEESGGDGFHPSNGEVSTPSLQARFREVSASFIATVEETSDCDDEPASLDTRSILPTMSSSSLQAGSADDKVRKSIRNAEGNSSSQIDPQEGLEVIYDECGFAGLLDAVALIGGETAGVHYGSLCTICGMSGLDVTKLVEKEVSLKVTGRLAFISGCTAYVLIDVREVSPSGKRKRVRSFDPVVCVFKTDQETETIPLKTKKAKKFVDIVKTRLDRSAVDGSVEVHAEDLHKVPSSPRKRAMVKSSVADFTMMDVTKNKSAAGASLCDGGHVLSALSRAARICVDNGLRQAEGSNVVSLDGFVVGKPDVLADAISLTVRVHLEGTCFGTSKVQAEATVKTLQGDFTTCRASFRVASHKHERLNSIGVVADETPLFIGSEIAEFFVAHSQRLPV